MKKEHEGALRLACNAQLLLDAQLTGIGKVACELLRALSARADVSVAVQAFAPGRARRARLLARVCYLPPERLHICTWSRTAPAQALWGRFPFTRRAFFPEADAYISFTGYMPCGIREPKLLFVYDMVPFRCPETMDEANRKKMQATLRASCARADAILTISEFSRREIIECMGVPPEKIGVARLGVDRRLFRADYAPAEVEACKARLGVARPYFMYLGTLEPRKNIVRLLEAYALLKERLPQAPMLLLCGRKGWLYEEIFAKVRALGLEADVCFTGYIEDADAPLLLRGARAFVFPSLYEGFGLPPLEAMACGTPVLCADAASLPEVVGEAGLLCDPLDAADIAEKLYALALDDGLCARLGAAGAQRAQGFTWENAARSVAQRAKSLCALKSI